VFFAAATDAFAVRCKSTPNFLTIFSLPLPTHKPSDRLPHISGCANERVKKNVGLNTAFGRIKPEPLPGRQETTNDEPNKPPGRQLSF